MTTWSGVGGKDIEDRTTIRETGNRLYSGDTRQRCHAACYNLHRSARSSWTPFAEACDFLELESESAEHEEFLGKP